MMFRNFVALILTTLLANALSAQNDNAPGGMVLIPEGSFLMGKDSKTRSNYSPAHKVQLNAFYMDTTEVTNQQYYQFCIATDHRLPQFWNSSVFKCGEDFPDYPVVGVSWADAKDYAEWAGKRLPTEAEWEYAARGGLVQKSYSNGDKWKYPKAKQMESEWNNLTSKVGGRVPNAYGLYDMGGNVWEWVSDTYSLTYYGNSEDENPKGPDKGVGKVIRGGSWLSGAMCKRVYHRKSLPGNWCDFAVGFRCVKDVD